MRAQLKVGIGSLRYKINNIRKADTYVAIGVHDATTLDPRDLVDQDVYVMFDLRVEALLLGISFDSGDLRFEMRMGTHGFYPIAWPADS